MESYIKPDKVGEEGKIKKMKQMQQVENNYKHGKY